MKIERLRITGFSLAITLLLTSCAGTIKTINYAQNEKKSYKKVYIIAAENSHFIKFKPGFILPTGAYVPAPDGPAVDHKVIGNTDKVIQKELLKYGINAEIVEKGAIPEEFDLLIEYHDTWRWDFKKVLDKLEIAFISPDGNLVSKSTYDIFKNKEIHNYPTPEKEVPKMMKQLMGI